MSFIQFGLEFDCVHAVYPLSPLDYLCPVLIFPELPHEGSLVPVVLLTLTLFNKHFISASDCVSCSACGSGNKKAPRQRHLEMKSIMVNYVFYRENIVVKNSRPSTKP